MRDLFFKKEFPPLYSPSGIYLNLRDMVFGISKQEGENGGVRSDDVLAFMMEVGMDDGSDCYSLAVIPDGSASLYFSNGGGILGAGENLEVAAAAKDVVKASESLLPLFDKSHQMQDYPLPSPAMVRFYFIKLGEVLSTEVPEDELEEGAHGLSALFSKAHELIVSMRILFAQKQS